MSVEGGYFIRIVHAWYGKEIREIVLVLEYTQWHNFTTVIEKAKMARETSENKIADHFANVSKMVNIGFDAKRNIEEQEWGKILEYVQKNPRQILDFYRPLLAEYREQVYELFTEVILREAAHSSKRSSYKNVCSYLRLLVKIGGNCIAVDLIKQLMFEHMRKPAFREELQKVKVK